MRRRDFLEVIAINGKRNVFLRSSFGICGLYLFVSEWGLVMECSKD